MTDAVQPPSRSQQWLYLISLTLRRLGLLVLVLGALRNGLTLLQSNLQHETVATIDRAWLRGTAPCIARDLELFKLVHAQRLKGLSEDQVRAEHAKQCAGISTGGSNVTLVLAWNDHQMKEYKTAVLVSTATADKLIESGRLQRDAIRVRYGSANPSGTLVLMEEIDVSLRESLYLLIGGGLSVVLGILGGMLFRARARPA